MNKVIFILSDGLRYDVAEACMSYMGDLVDRKYASLYKVISELPSLSRPLYETIHTGVSPHTHGIVNNSVVRRSNMTNIFQMVSGCGGCTAASAYCWFSELYNRAPYLASEDQETHDARLPIQHGVFYESLDHPDEDVFSAAAMLVRRWYPDYLLVHPMGMDTVGERYGAYSNQYRIQAATQDALLADYVEEWHGLGYHILVSADHGMKANGTHGGMSPAERDVPLYMLLADQKGAGDTGLVIPQLSIAPMLCNLLGIPLIGKEESLNFQFESMDAC
jgi:predicted AlkP superfamily pyrophosphatase or phosphodiesterase